MDYKQKIAVIGAGPAGCMCAYFASQDFAVTIFDFAKPLHTLLYTGGGRCNLAYEEYDFRELAKFYPRGEKFLYSIFSRFSTADTVEFFNNIGVETYIQDDSRIFPTSNSAQDVREKLLNKLKKCEFKKEKVLNIEKENEQIFLIETDKNNYTFDKVVIAVGGHAGFSLAQKLGHFIINPKPALTGLITSENFKSIQGVSLKNITAEIICATKKFPSVQGDIIFTHEGISGPLAYKISSICAREGYSKEKPLVIKLNFLQNDIDFQSLLNLNSKKDVKNLLADFVPRSLVEYILKINGIGLELKCSNVNGKTRDAILTSLQSFAVTVVSPAKDGEVVTSGGVCLDEINPKTMESKLVEGLYFCGEVIDVDGFCGGFNLQNCWSTGYISGNSIF